MLKLSVLGSAALLLPFERVARTHGGGDRLKKLPAPFRTEFTVPETLVPVRRTSTTDFYDITMKKADVELIPGLNTRIWGYNGQFPGPTIKATSGRRVVVRHTNKLSNPTSVHTHGAYADGDNDGHPADLIQPGESKTYYLDNDQTARTMWYHDHAHHITAMNVYRGLKGFYLIEDDFENNLPLPKGEYDVPLVIQDRLFFSDGSFNYPVQEDDNSTNGVYGDVILVNGSPWPRMEVANRKYRFRILNGSNARAYELALSTGEPLTLVGTEGGLLDKPVRLRSLPLSGAERGEVVIDFSRYPVGTRVVLKNLRPERGRKTRPDRLESNEPTTDVMCFDVVRKEKDDSRIPSVLRPAEEQVDPTHLAADPSEVSKKRKFVFERGGGRWTINRKTWDENRIDERPRERDTEIWEFVNDGGGWVHPIHVHLINFKILDRNGKPPFAHERGWKETVLVGPNEKVRVLVKWPKVPIGPEPGDFLRRYPFHCHLIEHEDHDMMLQFRVEEEGKDEDDGGRNRNRRRKRKKRRRRRRRR